LDKASSEGKTLMVSNTQIIVRPENRKEFFQTVSAIGTKIRREKGCVSFRVYEETENENSLMLVGEWDSKAYWDLHCAGENFAVLHGSVQILSIKSKIGHKLLSVLENS
jgi:quinol monooxygenase YgiN